LEPARRPCNPLRFLAAPLAPRRLLQNVARIIKRAPQRLEVLFEDFWDDQDFLLIEEFQDLPPDRARQLKEILRLPDEVIEPMDAALEQWNRSPNFATNLVGLRFLTQHRLWRFDAEVGVTAAG